MTILASGQESESESQQDLESDEESEIEEQKDQHKQSGKGHRRKANFKYNRPAPSQHGLNMNNISDGIGEGNPMMYAGMPKYYDRMMPPFNPYQIPGQSGYYPQGIANPLSQIENTPYPHPMAPHMMDPSMMIPRPPQGGVPTAKSEDYYRDLRWHYQTSFYPFSNELLKELVDQIDMYVQILIQTLLSTKDKSHQYQLYELLYLFTKQKEEIMKQLKLLPKFEIPWINPEKNAGKGSGEPLKIHPQVSFYQSPLLEYAYKIVKKIGK